MTPSMISRNVMLATGVLALAGAAYTCINYDVAGSESTEDAFVNGNVVAVTAQVGGVVTSLAADTTDHVSAGMPLVVLDDVDARLALDRAKAQLAKSVRLARAQVAAAGQNGANVDLRRVDLSRAKADLSRRRELLASGAISGEEVQHAEEAARVAEAALDAARQQWAGSQALVDRISLDKNPEVMTAAAQVRDAYIAAYRTSVPAPVSGVVTKRNVQLGQKITPGAALMSVVPLDHLWVDANFKESQLAHIRPGQPVKLSADLYGRSVSYSGIVVGQDAGTGSAFALLPAQNATGNWIKVVQRVPIRVALDPKQLAEHPLQLGLSMRVSVDTRRQEAPRLASHQSEHHGDQTDVLATPLAGADAIVNDVIAANR
ncbi:efflux RND transporter periplasmic adaptor subunit [Paucibacter sp. R3-3]|uniref:Efflux RND transporter periplasmic adaptor subunit n=1 Tax=Roseateles agri TaxID=3098619 RepID=A0ABU5DRX3_9BURK|nr:efflux RND transporter periplasmic adaptor subunit [Paucibacter sp. R3-3]MDY0749068.1 efflux RND transporter periplasmic adaptor subunit [Paucibacter sp. R3-3]